MTRGGRGSSPHTRGALSQAVEGMPQYRIIPAYAGSTSPSPARPDSSRDHPRIRGEHEWAEFTTPAGDGSSPHTRGARYWIRGGGGFTGIIPAYAGSTRAPLRRSRRCPDHPRIRGEHDGSARISRVGGGSSPHTRGALEEGADRHRHRRIIPAYAGSTNRHRRHGRRRRDHPRIRGEHSASSTWNTNSKGSSPHTRGAPAPSVGRFRKARIIPAYAGSTAMAPAGISSSWDHPRIRGEHAVAVVKAAWEGGSSPHTRGARRSSRR